MKKGDRNKHRGVVTLPFFLFLVEAKNEWEFSAKGKYIQTKFGYTLLSKIVDEGGVLNRPKDLDKK